MPANLYDKGVVLYLTKTAGTAYTDRKGAPSADNRSSVAFPGAAAYSAGDENDIGASGKCAIDLQYVLDGATVTVKVESQPIDLKNPALFTEWQPVRTVFTDATGTLNEGFEHALPAGTAVRLLTSDGALTGKIRVSGKSTDPAGANTVLIARLQGG